MYQMVANATFQITCGDSKGSGFSFKNRDTIITNYHVIETARTHDKYIQAETEDGKKYYAILESFSPENEYDFAVLRVTKPLDDDRVILMPEELNITRGRKVIFAGYPHGIPHLLTHEAIISAPLSEHGFYMDGMVNGGNSGGPIINSETGGVVGIVTQRRFVGVEHQAALKQKLSSITAPLRGYEKMTVEVMGVNFAELANTFVNGLELMSYMLDVNANAGIGIGYKIDFVNNRVN